MKISALKRFIGLLLSVTMAAGLWTVSAFADTVPTKGDDYIDYSDKPYVFEGGWNGTASYDGTNKILYANQSTSNRNGISELFIQDVYDLTDEYITDFDVSFPVADVDFTTRNTDKNHSFGIMIGSTDDAVFKLWFRINASNDILMGYGGGDPRGELKQSFYNKKVMGFDTSGAFSQKTGLSGYLISDGTTYTAHIVTKMDLAAQTVSVWINDNQIFNNVTVKGLTSPADRGSVRPGFGADSESISSSGILHAQIRINSIWGAERSVMPVMSHDLADLSNRTAAFKAAWYNTAAYNASTKTIQSNVGQSNTNSISELYISDVCAITDKYYADVDVTIPASAVDFSSGTVRMLSLILGSAGEYAYKLCLRLCSEDAVILGYSNDSALRTMSTGLNNKRIMGLNTNAGMSCRKGGLSGFLTSDGTNYTAHIVTALDIEAQTLSVWINGKLVFDKANTKGSAAASTYGDVTPAFGLTTENSTMNALVRVNHFWSTERADWAYDEAYRDLSDGYSTFKAAWANTAAYSQEAKTISGNVGKSNPNSIAELYVGQDGITKNYYTDFDITIPVSDIGSSDNRDHQLGIILGYSGEYAYKMLFRFYNNRTTHYSDILMAYAGETDRLTGLSPLLYNKRILGSKTTTGWFHQKANALDLFENDGTNYTAHIITKMDLENQTFSAWINGVAAFSEASMKGSGGAATYGDVSPAFGLALQNTVINPAIRINHIWTNETLDTLIAVPSLSSETMTADGLRHDPESLVTGFDGSKMSVAVTKDGASAEIMDAGTYTFTFTAKEGYTFGAFSPVKTLIISKPDTPAVSGEEKATVSLQLAVGETITAYYIVNVADPSEYDEVYLEAKLGDYAARKLTAEPVSGVYTFEYDKIFSQNMSDIISAKVFGLKNGSDPELLVEVGPDRQYSIAAYCKALHDAYSSDVRLNTFIANMLSYGAQAQAYIGYRTDSPADAAAWVSANVKSYEMTDAEAETAGVRLISNAAAPSQYKIKAAFLRIGQKVNIAFRIHAVDDSVRVKVSHEGYPDAYFNISDLREDTNANGYILDVENILPQNYDDFYTVSIVSADESGTVYHSVSYSVYSYLYAKRSSAGLAAFVQAIYDYSRAAKEYVE